MSLRRALAIAVLSFGVTLAVLLPILNHTLGKNINTLATAQKTLEAKEASLLTPSPEPRAVATESSFGSFEVQKTLDPKQGCLPPETEWSWIPNDKQLVLSVKSERTLEGGTIAFRFDNVTKEGAQLQINGTRGVDRENVYSGPIVPGDYLVWIVRDDTPLPIVQVVQFDPDKGTQLALVLDPSQCDPIKGGPSALDSPFVLQNTLS